MDEKKLFRLAHYIEKKTNGIIGFYKACEILENPKHIDRSYLFTTIKLYKILEEVL